MDGGIPLAATSSRYRRTTSCARYPAGMMAARTNIVIDGLRRIKVRFPSPQMPIMYDIGCLCLKYAGACLLPQIQIEIVSKQ